MFNSTALPQTKAMRSTWNRLASLGVCVRQHSQFSRLAFFVEKQFSEKEFIKTDFHQCRMLKLSKNVLSWKDTFHISVDHDVAKEPYHINIYEPWDQKYSHIFVFKICVFDLIGLGFHSLITTNKVNSFSGLSATEASVFHDKLNVTLKRTNLHSFFFFLLSSSVFVVHELKWKGAC
jgi:hypothetical protein